MAEKEKTKSRKWKTLVIIVVTAFLTWGVIKYVAPKVVPVAQEAWQKLDLFEDKSDL